MNNKNLNKVIQHIAEIQIEGLKRVKENPKGYDLTGLISEVVRGHQELQKGIQERIHQWEQILECPILFKTIDRYQLGISAHILFITEEELLNNNAEGVVDAWELIDKLYTLHHPEVKIFNPDIWKRKNLSEN